MTTMPFRTRVVVLLAFVIAPLLLSSCTQFYQILPRWADGQNVLQNGSFEDGTGPDGPFKPGSYGFMSLLPGSTTIPSWTVTGTAGGVDVAWFQNGPPNQWVPNAATDGSHFLDLTGSNDKRGPDKHFGGVTQAFPTVVDFDYHVFLDIGVFNNTSNPVRNFHGPISVIVGWSGPSRENYSEQICGPWNPTAEGAQWQTCDLRFRARSANTTVWIYGGGPLPQDPGTDAKYIGLDNVKVQCDAPLANHAYCTPAFSLR
jgi:hypothetical protein